MARINLLPWREELRRERQKQFLIALGIAAVLAVMVIVSRDLMLSSAIDAQKARNSFITTEIGSLDSKIREIKDLKTKKEELLARMKVIQNLQGNRPVIVRMFDELVRVMPDGVYFTGLTVKGGEINIQGVAESNNRISKLMRKLDESDWFSDPNLTAVKALNSGDGSTFDLTVMQSTPEGDGV
ncbi:PilN domain-containing protein [Sansalvadorimonas sp. 2012CJ34-2]|uniref:PilN domain-containing protein n=1 Tax=Parendozoicomonas callyspongiae TaxID=2942213 RepID=A0ABT0PGS8_9GAMM|nr:PilN domain-containing protein [Sansalvadorimonas sp. 2012CJ34-2]MCL6270590.1 PilN domain-containing protein [Sansalvadorimonas sp. 2012CJ34-2]